jgi:hypothetical protein
MKILDLLRNRDVLMKVLRILRQVASAASSVAEAREQLAKRLALGARAGDFDPAIRRAAHSDALVADFIQTGKTKR